MVETTFSAKSSSLRFALEGGVKGVVDHELPLQVLFVAGENEGKPARYSLKAQPVGRIAKGSGVVQTRHKLVYTKY